MVMFASSKLPSIKARRAGWTKQVSLFKKRFGLKFAFNKLQVQNTKNLNPRQKKKRSKKKNLIQHLDSQKELKDIWVEERKGTRFYL